MFTPDDKDEYLINDNKPFSVPIEGKIFVIEIQATA